MALEIECKYLEVEVAKLHRLLQEQNWQAQGGPYFEHNLLFETTPPSLTARKTLLRLRTMLGNNFRKEVLTLKLPAPMASQRSDFKVSDERETLVNGAQMRLILDGLGYKPFGCYEKVREVWRKDGVELALDRLCFINCVELEGEPSAITALAKSLELNHCPQSTASYFGLYQEDLQKKGLPASFWAVFAKDEKAKIAKTLALSPEALAELDVDF